MNEQSPPIPNRHRTASCVLLILDVIGLLLLLFFTTIVASQFEHVFSDLVGWNPLPVLTQVVLSIPRTVAIIVSGGTIGALIYKELWSSNKTRNLIINVTVLAAIVTLLVIFIFAMFLPLQCSYR